MIILRADGGLCNKLSVIGSGKFLAEQLGVPVHVLWITDKHMENIFSELFEPDPSLHIHEIKLNSRIARRIYAELERMFFIAANPIAADFSHKEKFERMVERTKGRGLLFYKTCERFRPFDNLDWLKQLPTTKAKIDKFAELAEGAVGFHIRRTDHRDAIRCSPAALFYKKAEELIGENPECKIFLSTDDDAIRADFKRRWPNNVTIRANVLSRTSDRGGGRHRRSLPAVEMQQNLRIVSIVVFAYRVAHRENSARIRASAELAQSVAA